MVEMLSDPSMLGPAPPSFHSAHEGKTYNQDGKPAQQ
jgi:hypothetical protein